MDDAMVTTVEAEAVSAEKWEAAERQFKRQVAKLAQIEAWKAFGTIGFEAYRSWVLETESRREIGR